MQHLLVSAAAQACAAATAALLQPTALHAEQHDKQAAQSM
jgi:hypothetical protein